MYRQHPVPKSNSLLFYVPVPVLVVLVDAPVDLVVLLPLSHVLDLLRPVAGPGSRNSSANRSFGSRFIKSENGSKLCVDRIQAFSILLLEVAKPKKFE
jgi:hypothetical protein